MIARTPRVAYFPDSFHEVNGVARTARHFEAFARQCNLPFLCVRAGDRTPAFLDEGSVWTLELPRGFLSFPIEKDLRFDPAFLRHFPRIERVMRRFRPDLIQITGPSEVGLLGAWMAHYFQLPLVSSWHTNLHEYAARRAQRFLHMLSDCQSCAVGRTIEAVSLAVAARFYSLGQMLLAPNPALCSLLERVTGRPCHLAPGGVDPALFHPAKRRRSPADRSYVLGFVGRLSVEKNIAHLVQVQKELEQMGYRDFRFLIVGQGAHEAWLRERLPRAEFVGVLHGEDLATAYANMDLFVFPSHTDTFANVVLEALASGVPAIVNLDGGPRTIVRDGETGRIVPDTEFSAAIAALLADPIRHDAMRQAARAYGLSAGWDTAFEGIYTAYETILPGRHLALAS